MKCIHVWVWVAIVNFFFLLGRKSRELLLNDIPTIKMLILAHINNIVCKLFWTISKPESQRYDINVSQILVLNHYYYYTYRNKSLMMTALKYICMNFIFHNCHQGPNHLLFWWKINVKKLKIYLLHKWCLNGALPS